MNTNTIAVIGGTGKSGQFLVQNLLNKQYPIRMLLRNPENFTLKSPLINIVKGDVRNSEAVHHLIKDCNVVISTLGQSVGEKSIFSDATGNIIKAMNSYGINRYIVTTGLNVNTPFDHKNEKVKMATDWMYQNYPETTTDKQKEYELLNKSNLNWTLVRLPLINLTDESFATETSLQDCKGETISATDLAKFLISQMDDQTFCKQSPFLYNI
ncbi:NAD(P)H-binding protein [Chryseobacterium gambrini]|uniref:NAD(P)H-binding protein n=1 Tax=Chryseobacterium gambrini TaxID=373672 RepID=A0AAJ1R108_9FLAO|nr:MULTISPECIES: NAD(P)H-binding protein [Chryseobacterium]MDN4011741.1 NAD(P)H-binding protein [Chryseobacterium gambrini]MDN4029260.1 NAD(P)H-binding protein [Chryseobacterium gambrini]QWA39073.1 NAD(P)H-binding protein [Chryseobacterium sp. ZHDP1]